MNARLRIGLTGGIASGKSTVSQRFIELGIPVIDADLAARRVVEPGSPGLRQVVARFGTGILNGEGELDRPALRNVIFSDPEARKALDDILHPLIRAQMEQEAADATGPYLILSIPLLVEGGRAHSQVDRILVVDVDEARQLERVQRRDGSSLEQARAMLASQATRAARLAEADDVLPNSGTVADLRQSVDFLHQRYLQMAQARLAPRASS
ncbi:MAG TPA: dephospho-CoA kinase [Steroidobacteraceae bacterium]